MISFANPLAQYQSHQTEIDAAIHTVLNSGHYILGEQVAAFENEFARYLGLTNAVGVASGTDALVLALMALGVGRDDEVILPSMTATATANAVKQVGATPVFVDIKKNYYKKRRIARPAYQTNSSHFKYPNPGKSSKRSGRADRAV